MSDPILKKLSFDLHARLLARQAGGSSLTCYLAPSGAWLASSDEAEAREIAGVLGELREAEDAPAAEGRVRTLRVGTERTLLHVPDGRGAPHECGLLGLVLPHELPTPRAAELEELLAELATSLGREYRLQREADDLAGELAARHEELNLVYSLDEHMQSFDRTTGGVESLLRDLIERLEIDLAAFVLPTRRAPIHACKSGSTIPNLDLVLTAARGDLFRFTSAHGAPVVINEPEDRRRHYLLVNMPYRVLACPVTAGREVRGMLVLVRETERPAFTNGDRSLALVIARQIAILLQNQAMLSSLEHFGAQMAAALIAAIESKDPYTRGHSERVQHSSVDLGRAAGLGARALDDVSWGALLHDVGKIGIPDEILCKAGALSDDEYSMIKTHPERSFEIMAHIEHLGQGAIDAARHHHERFDGTGYPQGLRGEEIPLSARVVAIADTYDAITSSRSYRPGRTQEKALEIVRGAAGSQLDDALVQVFLNMFERGGGPKPPAEEPGERGDG